MDPATAMFAVGAARGVMSYFGSRSAAQQQRRGLREQLRRTMRQNDITLGRARAYNAASGFQAGGSQGLYLTEMADEMRRQVDWLRKTGMQEASNTQKAGTYNLFSDIGSSLINFGQQNNWFRQPQTGSSTPYYLARP